MAAEKLERLQEVQASLKKVEASFAEARDQMKTELEGMLAEVQDTEQSMSKLKRSHQDAIKHSQNALQELDFE